MANWGGVLREAAKIGIDLLARQTRQARQDRAAPRTRPGERGPAPGATARTAPTGARMRTIIYSPDIDGAADPGEIVWTWVPFEEADGRGKDRPLLVVGRDGRELVGLMLSSQQDRARDPDWVSIGTGAWDREGRESFVRLDRVLVVDEHGIRREGAVLDRNRFERVAGQLRQRFGWH